MKNPGFSKDDAVADEVQVNLNVFGPLVLNGVRRHVHGANVVAVDHRGPQRWVVKLL
jgi:hypothetical protein